MVVKFFELCIGVPRLWLLGFPCILESPGIYLSKFKALKVLENRVGP